MAGAVYTIETSRTFQQQGETDKAFIYTDHLGSTDLITDKGGNVIQSMSFNAWGQRRDADSWDLVTDVIAQRFTERTSRGYTSHEQLDEVGLIHMNGRIYDPRLARFLQADPFIQAPGNTQSYNRYSYVWNNPLNATDPSGFFLKKLKKIWDNAFRPFVGAIVGAVVTAYCAPCSGVWGAMFAGGAAGAAGAAANNGNVLQGMLTGAVGGAMFYGIGASFSEPGALNAFGRAVTSGSVGGLMAMSQGGRFAHGFAAAGIGSFGGGGSTPAGFIRSAVLGGIASEVTGGKFKNGAATAAFTWALSRGASRTADSGVEPRYDSAGSSGSHLSDIEKATAQMELTLAVDGVERQRFETADLAAQALHEAVSPITAKWGIEIGAMIHDASASGYFGQVVVGDVTTDFLSGSVGIRSLPGFDRVASYHTHPRSSMFSPDDFYYDFETGINGYLSARDGKLLRFDQEAFRESGLPRGRGYYRKFVSEVR